MIVKSSSLAKPSVRRASRGIRVVARPGRVLMMAGCVLASVLSAPLASAAPARAAARAAPASAAAGGVRPAWTSPAGIPSAETNGGSPAVVTYDGKLYAAWQGESSPYHIWYSVYNGSTWSPEATVPNALTNYRTGPALAVYDGDLYVAWQGQTTPFHVWYASFNGSTWSHQAEEPNALVHISSTVGMVGYGGSLYLAWTGQTSPYSVYYAAFNGSTWTPEATIPGSSSDNFQATDTPLASYDGKLYASWETGSLNDLEYATFDGTSWAAPVALGYSSDAGPALAVRAKKLYESWINYSNLDVDWSVYNGSTWTAPAAIPGASIFIELGPAIAEYAGYVVAAWAPDSSPSAIEYSTGPT
jgi:hypothetical protein